MGSARYWHGLFKYDGIVYAFGGWNGSTIKSVEQYEICSDKWTCIQDLPKPCSSISCARIQSCIYMTSY